jgi:hypothetical protein
MRDASGRRVMKMTQTGTVPVRNGSRNKSYRGIEHGQTFSKARTVAFALVQHVNRSYNSEEATN